MTHHDNAFAKVINRSCTEKISPLFKRTLVVIWWYTFEKEPLGTSGFQNVRKPLLHGLQAFKILIRMNKSSNPTTRKPFTGQLNDINWRVSKCNLYLTAFYHQQDSAAYVHYPLECGFPAYDAIKEHTNVIHEPKLMLPPSNFFAELACHWRRFWPKTRVQAQSRSSSSAGWGTSGRSWY